MNKYIVCFMAFVLLASCGKKNETEEKIAETQIPKVEVKRFDQRFFEANPKDLPHLKEEFEYLFPLGDSDAVWIEKMQDPFNRKLYDEVQKKYPKSDGLEEDLEDLFRHIKYYYPDFRVPEVVTLSSDDIETKIIYTGDMLLIPLSLYLGKDNYLYEGLPQYQVQEFEAEHIMPDIAAAFTNGKIASRRDRTLLSTMIYFGKELYIKDLLVPDATDAAKMGYTKEQQAWAEANEAEIWRYFVEKNLLYDTDPKLPGRFINPAPFSKFYLELDNESPGRLGRWLGWQIVRSYMENNKNVTLQELLAMDAKTIFDNSKYKPKK